MLQNIVATIDLKFPIKIEKLYETHCQFSRFVYKLDYIIFFSFYLF